MDVLRLDERDVRRARRAEALHQASTGHAAIRLGELRPALPDPRRSRTCRGRRSTPPSDVPWPPRNFVAECTTMSAPKSFARCRYGVATVLSITSGTPARWATAATARTSSTCAIGLVIDSAKNARVSGRTAAAQASASSWSTNVTSMPQSANVSCEQVDGAAVELLARRRCARPAWPARGARARPRPGPRRPRRRRCPPSSSATRSLEHEHGRVRGAAVDVAVAAEREQVARLAQRGELEGVRLVDRRERRCSRRHRGRYPACTCVVANGAGWSSAHSTIVERAAPASRRPIVCRNCCAAVVRGPA